VVGRLVRVIQSRRDDLPRERLREYEAALTAARAPVEVLVSFAKARENHVTDERLGEAFATSTVEGVDEADQLPAAVWVALRQGDVDAVVQTLVQTSNTEFVLATHDQLDAGYRLTTVDERRGLPDVGRLEAQVAAFLRIPRDVVAMITSWGVDDPARLRRSRHSSGSASARHGAPPRRSPNTVSRCPAQRRNQLWPGSAPACRCRAPSSPRYSI
jgi:hypothetical protein